MPGWPICRRARTIGRAAAITGIDGKVSVFGRCSDSARAVTLPLTGLEVDRRRRVWIDPADSAVTVADRVPRWFRSLDLG